MKKGVYLLPSLVTLGNLGLGFYAIIMAINHDYLTAAICIILAGCCDGFDGMIARYTNTTSNFGVELDSLADLVSFGVAPAILAYQFSLHSFGRVGWLSASLFVMCGALRLARFNVQTSDSAGAHFSGLPIPAAAAVVASFIILAADLGFQPFFTMPIAMLLISYLMVSNLTYISVKKYSIHRRWPFGVLIIVLLVLWLVAQKPLYGIFILTFSYTLSGLVLRVVAKTGEIKILDYSVFTSSDN